MRTTVAGIEGWLTDREVDFLYQTARDCLPGGMILEIGSYKGKSAVCLAMGSAAGNSVPVWACDPHIGKLEQKMWMGGKRSFDEFQENVNKAGVSDLVVPVVKTSAETARTWDKPISFLWIDGDHSHAAARLDFDQFSEWVVEGGVIAFHDSTQGDLPKVVCECLGREGFVNIGLVDSIAHATKCSQARKSLRDRFILFCVANYHHARKIRMLTSVKGAIKSAVSSL